MTYFKICQLCKILTNLKDQVEKMKLFFGPIREPICNNFLWSCWSMLVICYMSSYVFVFGSHRPMYISLLPLCRLQSSSKIVYIAVFTSQVLEFTVICQ